MPGSWILAVDFGTSNTGAAIRFDDGRVDKVKLDPGSDTMPSAAVLTDGHWRVGRAAYNARWASPQTFVASPKTRLGHEPLLLDGALVDPAQVSAEVIAAVRDRAVAAAGGGAPDRLVLTHPARWGQVRLDALREAARLAGFSTDAVRLLPEPIAALHAHVAPGSLPPGSRVAVVDIGGGTCDVAVLHVTDDPTPGKDLLVVAQEGDDQLGGDYLDELLYQWVVAQLGADGRTDMVAALADPANADAAMTLLDVVRSAKQDLSEHTSAPVAVSVSGHKTALTITRDEYETLIAEPVARAGDLAARALAASGTTDLAGLYLTGGTAYTPALARVLHLVTGILTSPIGDPKLAVALGALKTPTAVLDPSELFALTQDLTARRRALEGPASAQAQAKEPAHAPQEQAPQERAPQDQASVAAVRPRRRRMVLVAAGAIVAVVAVVVGLWLRGGPDPVPRSSTSPSSATPSTAAPPPAHACWDGSDDAKTCPDFAGAAATRFAFAPEHLAKCALTGTDVKAGLFYEEDCSGDSSYQPYTAWIRLWADMKAAADGTTKNGYKKNGTWKNSDGDTVGNTYKKSSSKSVRYCYDTIPVCLETDMDPAWDEFGTLSASQVADVAAWLDGHGTPDPTKGWDTRRAARAFPAAGGADPLVCSAADLGHGANRIYDCQWPLYGSATVVEWYHEKSPDEFYGDASEPWIVDGVERGTVFLLDADKRWCYKDAPYCIRIDFSPDRYMKNIAPLTQEQAASF